jgi:hypothetical protein
MTDEEVQFLISVGFTEVGRTNCYVCDSLQTGRVVYMEYDRRHKRWTLTEIDEARNVVTRTERSNNAVALWQDLLFNP